MNSIIDNFTPKYLKKYYYIISVKSLTYFWINGEWAELESSQFELINKPGYVSSKNKEFVSRIKTLEYSY